MAWPDRSWMEQQLLRWNPHWRRETVQGWHSRQLYAVYQKERLKRASLLPLPQSGSLSQ